MMDDCSRDPSEYDLPTMRQLRAIRISLDLTIREVAEDIGRNKDTLWRWEHKERVPKVSDVRALVELYKDERCEG